MNCKATIEQWRSSILELEEHQFFDIIRLYLGDIKTPYNKQRLLEQLAGFIHNEENQDSILSLLDQSDLALLTAIYFIGNPTKALLADFFSTDYPIAVVYDQLSNLVSRLILFLQKDPYSGKEYYRITPFLESRLLPLLSVSNILKPEEVVSENITDQFTLSPNFLAAFISFLNHQGCACKNDGSIKKTDLIKIESLFPGRKDCIQLLINAFITLSLVTEGDRKLEVDYTRLELFAVLAPSVQYALLTVASCIHLGRDKLKRQTELLLDCLESIPQNGCSIASVKKIAFLASANKTGIRDSVPSRFSQLLNSVKKVDDQEESSGNLIELMLSSAVEFGLLVEIGKNEEGIAVYKKSELLSIPSFQEHSQKVLNVDSTFTVTVLPGLNLSQLLPLTEFLQINSFSVVTEFILTKQSASNAFDNGINAEKLFSIFADYSSYGLPQNIRISISEWYESYISSMVYFGYVLKVTGNNISIAENNPYIKRHLKEKLAEGIYLLDVPPTKEISAFLESSGLDFMGKVRTTIGQEEKIPFPRINKGIPVVFDRKQTVVNHSYTKGAGIIKELKNELEKMDLTPDQKENLLHRINNRLIISLKQLGTTCVRTELLEASGTNYGGKFHLLDSALATGDSVEIIIPDYSSSGSYLTLVGKPIGLTKQTSDAIVRFELLPNHNIENFLVSKITHLKRLRF